jgi:hypothetical protein
MKIVRSLKARRSPNDGGGPEFFFGFGWKRGFEVKVQRLLENHISVNLLLNDVTFFTP